MLRLFRVELYVAGKNDRAAVLRRPLPSDIACVRAIAADQLAHIFLGQAPLPTLPVSVRPGTGGRLRFAPGPGEMMAQAFRLLCAKLLTRAGFDPAGGRSFLSCRASGHPWFDQVQMEGWIPAGVHTAAARSGDRGMGMAKREKNVGDRNTCRRILRDGAKVEFSEFRFLFQPERAGRCWCGLACKYQYQRAP